MKRYTQFFASIRKTIALTGPLNVHDVYSFFNSKKKKMSDKYYVMELSSDAPILSLTAVTFLKLLVF